MLHIGIIATVCQAIVRLAEYGLHFCLRGPRSLVNKVMCEYLQTKVVGGVSLRSPLIVLCIWRGCCRSATLVETRRGLTFSARSPEAPKCAPLHRDRPALLHPTRNFHSDEFMVSLRSTILRTFPSHLLLLCIRVGRRREISISKGSLVASRFVAGPSPIARTAH